MTTTKTPSPSPSPTPTVAAAPSQRVPSTCEQLFPLAAASAAAQTGLAVDPFVPDTPSALRYAPLRVGALTCSYTAPATDPNAWPHPMAYLQVVPTEGRNDDFGSAATEWGPDIAGGAYFLCADPPTATCVYGRIVGPYQLIGSLSTAASSSVDQEQVRALVQQAADRVAALPTPAPLWEPAGGSLKGVTDPEGFLPLDRIARTLGVDSVRSPKSEGGEYTTAPASADLVGAFWADYVADSKPDSLGIAMLPGGAPYYDERLEHPLTGIADIHHVADLGDDAFTSTYTPPAFPDSVHHYLDVKVKNSWLQLDGADPAVLQELAAEVIANLGG